MLSLPHLATQALATPTPNPTYTTHNRAVDALVIGSGISGSTLAHYLAQADVDVLLAEQRPVVGGNVISRANDDGYVWEEGPNSFQPTPAVMRTAYEAGVGDELVFADATLPPWVYYGGTLHALPKNLPGDLLNFNLLSWPGKIRAGLGAVGLLLAPPPEKHENIEEFVTRHLGREAFARIIDPFVSGVYAGDPKKLEMRAALKKIFRLQTLSFNGALVPGALVRFQEIAREKADNPPDPAWPTYKSGELGSFRRGLQTLPNAIAAKLGEERVALNHRLVGVRRADDGSGAWLATFDTPDGETVVRARALVSTAPAHAVADVLAPVMPEAARLKEVYYPPVASVTVAYPKSAFKNPDLPGFGSLNPRSEGVRTLGTIWSSSLFPNRAPPDHNLLLNYIGGSRDVDIANLSEDEIVAEVHKGCQTVLLKPGAPQPRVLGVKLWPTAIPQYEAGHLDLLAELDAAEQRTPGLYLGGNYRTGVAFGDCVQYGLDQAAAVKAYLSKGVH